jgi:hypothetical protein
MYRRSSGRSEEDLCEVFERIMPKIIEKALHQKLQVQATGCDYTYTWPNHGDTYSGADMEMFGARERLPCKVRYSEGVSCLRPKRCSRRIGARSKSRLCNVDLTLAVWAKHSPQFSASRRAIRTAMRIAYATPSVRQPQQKACATSRNKLRHGDHDRGSSCRG